MSLEGGKTGLLLCDMEFPGFGADGGPEVLQVSYGWLGCI